MMPPSSRGSARRNVVTPGDCRVSTAAEFSPAVDKRLELGGRRPCCRRRVWMLLAARKRRSDATQARESKPRSAAGTTPDSPTPPRHISPLRPQSQRHVNRYTNPPEDIAAGYIEALQPGDPLTSSDASSTCTRLQTSAQTTSDTDSWVAGWAEPRTADPVAWFGQVRNGHGLGEPALSLISKPLPTTSEAMRLVDHRFEGEPASAVRYSQRSVTAAVCCLGPRGWLTPTRGPARVPHARLNVRRRRASCRDGRTAWGSCAGRGATGVGGMRRRTDRSTGGTWPGRRWRSLFLSGRAGMRR